ncbi:MAG: gluconokinase [Hyphomicrobiaceae bacterium]|nr:gluconokinase [Hyphomicrobiaceae bacterium]
MTHPEPNDQAPLVIVLMGVSGSGKSTVGAELSRRLGWPFRDADSFHPAANIEKMSRGMPLTDADRWPWLDAIAAWIDDRLRCGTPGIVSCSALKRAYRRRILGGRGRVRLVYLKGEMGLIAARLATRTGHFMPAGLLASQFEALEEPQPQERAVVVPIIEPPPCIAATIITEAWLGG